MKLSRVIVGLWLVALVGCAHGTRENGPINVGTYKEPIRVACVGDSITFGAGVEDRERNHYPAQLGRMLGPKWEVRNYGVSGTTLLKKGDMPYWKRSEYQQALDWKPDVVIIKLGTNDTKPQNWKYKDEYVADYEDLIGQFRKVNPAVRVYACLPVPAFPGNWGIREAVIKGEVIPRVRQVAKESHVQLIDLYAALEGKKELVPDTVHPNAKGAGVMARTIYKVLTGKEAPQAVMAMAEVAE
ncbi:MAG: GDSL-type esterase/lipase family protein [Bacillota bacterium]